MTEYTKAALDDGRVRVIGVCFGHQIVGRALQQRVGRGDKWEISVTPMELTSEGKRLFKQDKVVSKSFVYEWKYDLLITAYRTFFRCTGMLSSLFPKVPNR